MERTLRFGARGPEVVAWQQALAAAGHQLKADGLFGARTETATRAIQRAHGKPATGVADPETRALLQGAPEAIPEPRAYDEQAARWGMVERALAVVGLGAAAPDAYLDLVAPNEADRADATTCAGMMQMSGCALVVRGLWVRAGIRHPLLLGRYRIGRAVADVVEVARSAAALRPPTDPIKPGDVVVIGSPEHVLTVTAIVPTREGTMVQSVDGGQRDAAGKQLVAKRERALSGTTLGQRPILYLVDSVALHRHWMGGHSG